MTENDWKTIDTRLKSVLSMPVELKIDGYVVQLSLEQVSQFKNAIVVYIDGKIKGEWLMKDCEERRRFFACTRKSVVKESDIKAFGKKTSKKQKQAIEELKEKYSYNIYSFAWTNFNKMKKHFIANNNDIELLN